MPDMGDHPESLNYSNKLIKMIYRKMKANQTSYRPIRGPINRAWNLATARNQLISSDWGWVADDDLLYVPSFPVANTKVRVLGSERANVTI